MGLHKSRWLPKFVGLVLAISMADMSLAHAACTLPYSFTNGQPTDASQVMANYNALLSCINTSVSPGTAGQVGYYAADGAAISGETLSSLIDSSAGSTQGSILYRDATTWKLLPPGPASQFLQTQGAGANPQWATPPGASGSTLLTSLTSDHGNGNDTTEDELASYTMPGNTMGSDGDTLVVYALLQFAGNTHQKTAKLYFGATNLGGVNTNISSTGTFVEITGTIVRRSATTQIANKREIAYSGTPPDSSLNAGLSFAQIVSPSETLSGPIAIRVTGQTGTAAANDVVLKIFNVRKL